ncbi:39S ribosomal protein L46, mitochondrial [Indicator indicator]|uniref:39S ribosomal protein L46, mitochondrial n=1 Tax=Indicator indicator TaxID=1002788 RepID=UPI0023DF27D3|nr:39S ribosomal protein L46, mitochondrial [Indicator indicator]
MTGARRKDGGVRELARSGCSKARRERGGKMAASASSPAQAVAKHDGSEEERRRRAAAVHCGPRGAVMAASRQGAVGWGRWLCTAAAPRPWKLFGAMCLLRLPRITQPLEKEEEEMAALMEQIELEKSQYSDHEIRKMQEEEQLRKRKESMYDDEGPGKTVIMAQDLEEKWEQRFMKFEAAPRITDADKKNDRTSLDRRLDSNLLLLVKQKIGNQELWLLPQAEWQPGETLRSTAERAMAMVLGGHVQAKTLGNAPSGIYKYKFPRAIRTEDNVGAKVFFFKAFLQSSDLSQAEPKEDYLWVTKDELGGYLKSEYLKKVNRFLLDL